MIDNSIYLPSDNIGGKYQVWINALVSNNCLVTDSGKFINCLLSETTGKFQALGTGEINTLEDIKNNLQHDNYNVIFSSDSMVEVVSFMSYAYTKFVRFLIFNSICGLRSTGQDTWWRFVPNQVFDHIYDDEELYKRYRLTQGEIEIIEGTIADRPLKDILAWVPKELQLIFKEEVKEREDSKV